MISTMPLCMATNHEKVDIMDQTHFSRRSFLRQKTTTIATSAAFYGFFVNFDDHASNCQCSTCQGLKGDDGHDESCQCNVCSNANNMVGNHGKTCQCHSCMRLGPLAANAYERDVGDENRSPETYAMNLQAKKTNARLEASGFQLDSKEEEASRLSDAMASFSYDDSMSGKKYQTGKNVVGKGYKTNKNVQDGGKM